MPCGGIFPSKGSWTEPYFNPNFPCGYCGNPIADINEELFVLEWDDVIHKKCLEGYKTTKEYNIIEQHGHTVSTTEPMKDMFT